MLKAQRENTVQNVHSDFNVRTDQMRLQQLDDMLGEDEENINSIDENSLSLIKCRSERKLPKSIMQELQEDAYNTHIDDLQRRDELEGYSPQKKDLFNSLDRLVDYHVEEIIAHTFQEKELQEIFQNDDREDAEAIWKRRFMEYAIKAIRLVKPSQRLMKDTMDINDYIQIELIEHEDDSK